ncbi:MAG: hypothetical protein Q8O88_01480 [bacterium]|nr:hypothetical protein [bacterium]
MYTGKTGLRILQAHVKRFETNGTTFWTNLPSDYNFIKMMFGTEAADWLETKKLEYVSNFLLKTEKINNILVAKSEGQLIDNAKI